MRRAFHLKRILIPFDFSDTASLALEHGVFMAKLAKAEITLLHVIESYSFASAITNAFSKTQSEYEEKVETSANDKFREMADKIHHESGVVVNYQTVRGKIYKAIVSAAKDSETDIIIMGTHGTSGFQEYLVGSNTYKVVSSAPCPVISVQTHAKKIGFHDIVMPIDNSSTSRQKVPLVIELAKKYKSVVHIAGMMNFTDVDLQRRFEVKVHQVKDFVEEHEVAHTVKIFKGENPTTTLIDYSTQINADLMVIMTDQEGSGMFMGSAAQQLVNHSSIPIMSIRPDEGDPDKISVGY
ncbi:MAG: universal stress protein [Bacteroidetes bacterium]|nr:universal stress protein [Bacteroidota bacterium]